MGPGINGLSHADIVAVLNQVKHDHFRSDQGITFNDHTVQPQALLDVLTSMSEKSLRARILRVIDNDLSHLPGADEKQLPVGVLASTAL